MNQVTAGFEKRPGIGFRQRRTRVESVYLTARNGFAIHQRAGVLGRPVAAVGAGGKQPQVLRPFSTSAADSARL